MSKGGQATILCKMESINMSPLLCMYPALHLLVKASIGARLSKGGRTSVLHITW